MQRRAFFSAALQAVQGSSSLLAFGLGMTSLLAESQRAFALGGTLPDLNGPAPDFNLAGVKPSRPGIASAATETQLELADFSGQWLVLYFYPKDFTSGCTLEARSFQAALADLRRLGADVVGVSADAAEDHSSFCAAEGLTYPLLSDPGGTVSRAYGSWLAPYSQRHTFLIDPNGQLRARWLGVRPLGHGQEVLAELQRQQQLQASPG